MGGWMVASSSAAAARGHFTPWRLMNITRESRPTRLSAIVSASPPPPPPRCSVFFLLLLLWGIRLQCKTTRDVRPPLHLALWVSFIVCLIPACRRRSSFNWFELSSSSTWVLEFTLEEEGLDVRGWAMLGISVSIPYKVSPIPILLTWNVTIIEFSFLDFCLLLIVIVVKTQHEQFVFINALQYKKKIQYSVKINSGIISLLLHTIV